MADVPEDEFEYHVSFPSTSDGQLPEWKVSDGTIKEPVVFLLGWAGCKDKYLSKYAPMYENKGCITIRYTVPLKYIFVDNDHIKVLAEKLLGLLGDMNLKDHPILFHCFSNGGAITYHFISELLHESPNHSLNVVGCSFDSCPSRRSFRSICSAFWELMPGNLIVKILLQLCFGLYLFARAFWWVSTSILKSEKLVLPPWTLIEEPSVWPQLFLYSKSDHIVDYKEVEEFIGARKARSVPVQQVCWDDSLHVQHLRSHREAYINAVSNFLDDCINSVLTKT